ncbi:hypothetical protein UlMin_008758 [Ulmus minor]
MAYPFSKTCRPIRNDFVYRASWYSSNPNGRQLQFLASYSSSLDLYCCSSSCSTSQRGSKKRKSHVIERTHKGILLGRSSGDLNKESGLNLGWKKVVKRQRLWRRILFASKKVRSVVLLNFITIIYASDILVVKGAEETMDPAAFSAVRFVMAAIPFLPFVFQARDDVKTRKAGLELGFWLSLAYFIEAIGLLTSEAGRASFISLVTVIAVPLLDGMLGAVIPTRTWFGVLMSAFGIGMLECSGSPPSVGDLLNFLSAIFFGIHMLRTEHFSRSTSKENLTALIGYEACVVALLSTMWVLVGGWFDGFHSFNQSKWEWTELWDWIVEFPWIHALYTGVFSTGLCSWIEFAAMRDVSATETAIIYGLEPLWGAGFAWCILGERWGMLGWIGATLVLGGSLMLQLFGSSPTCKSVEAEEDNQKCDRLLVPNEQIIENGLSASPLVVRTRKDVMAILK